MNSLCDPKDLDDFVLFDEDCLTTTRRLPNECIDLLYVDPPFCSGRLYSTKGQVFDDRWASLEAYLDWARPRLAEFHRILKKTGSIYIHCDGHVSHYLKVLTDTIFNRKNFLNEIVWRRQSSHNDAQQGSRHFGRIHDTILVYVKSGNYVWNQEYVPYEDTYVKRTYRYVELETGRRYALGDLTGPGGHAKGNPFYRFLGIYRHWRYSKTRMSELFVEGRIFQKKGRVPLLKRYLDEMNGRPLQDIWSDIKPDHPSKIIFPTQKPLGLIERIVRVSSHPGQLVYDPFSGASTSGIACLKLSRRWVGSELLKDACRLSSKRFEALGYKVKLFSEFERENELTTCFAGKQYSPPGGQTIVNTR